MSKPDVIKAALNKAKDIERDLQVIKPLSKDFIAKAIKVDNIYAKQIWNAAVEAVAQLSLADRQNPDIIRTLKK